MVALGKRLPRVPIGVIRCGIEGTVLLVGYLLGAKVGIGTVIAVLAIGFLLQQTCRILGLDLKGIHHESIFATISTLKERFSKR